MDKKTILVTGGCGAIGSVVLNTLMPLYPDTKFVNLDALTYAGNENHINPSLNNNYLFVKGDICNYDIVAYVLTTYQPNIILHLAAETHVDNSFGNSFQFTKTNVVGTHTMLECARQYRDDGGLLELFMHMSTDEVYGSVDQHCTQPCDEWSLLLPSNPYSASKCGAEMIAHAYRKSFKLPVIIVRCNNAISQYQYPEKLIPKTIQRILQGKKVPVHGKGMSLRTFIDAADIARALDIIINRGTIGKVYNIGSDEEYTVLEVIETILRLMKPDEKLENWIEFVPDRAFQDYRYWIDNKVLKELGWTQQITFEQAIQKVISTTMAANVFVLWNKNNVEHKFGMYIKGFHYKHVEVK